MGILFLRRATSTTYSWPYLVANAKNQRSLALNLPCTLTKLLLKNCIFFNGIFSILKNQIVVNIGFLLWKMTGLSSRSWKGHQKNNLSTVAWDISKKVAKHGGLVWIAWFWQFFVIISSYGTQIFFWWPFCDCQLKPVILHIRNPIFTTIWFLSFEKIPLKNTVFQK